MAGAPEGKGGKVTELFCEAGQHTWDRATQRGRQPKNCPDHAHLATSRRRVPVAVEQSTEERITRLMEALASFENRERKVVEH